MPELIRRRLTDLEEDESPSPRFFQLKPWNGSAPEDLSADHDRYLYDE